MIASVAIEHDIPLLHHDRDFDGIAVLGSLKVVKTRKKWGQAACALEWGAELFASS